MLKIKSTLNEVIKKLGGRTKYGLGLVNEPCLLMQLKTTDPNKQSTIFQNEFKNENEENIKLTYIKNSIGNVSINLEGTKLTTENTFIELTNQNIDTKTFCAYLSKKEEITVQSIGTEGEPIEGTFYLKVTKLQIDNVTNLNNVIEVIEPINNEIEVVEFNL